MKQKNNLIKILVLLILIIFPWFLNLSESKVNPEKLTSDLRFYEINTCEITLFKFLIKNYNVIYQDHYKIVNNNYSSLNCYGTITGIDQINDIFYISIGTNSFVSLILFSIWYLLILSLLPSEPKNEINLKKYITVGVISSIFLTLGIYSQFKYYEKYLYLTNPRDFTHLFKYFLVFFSISLFSIYLIETRKRAIFIYSPFVFLLIGTLQGFNLNFFIITFYVFGIYNFSKIFRKYKLYIFYYFSLMLFWFVNSFKAKPNLYFNPDKLVGLTNTSNSPESILFISILFLFFLIGVFSISFPSKNNLELKNFELNLLISSFLVLTFGLLSSQFPLLRFLNFLYFGQQKFSTDNQKLISFNEWGELIAWRGHSSSAESIGEFYSIAIMLFLISYYFYNKKNNYFLLIPIIIFALLGLLASNNRAALISIIFISFLIMFKNIEYFNKLKKMKITKFLFFGISILLIYYFSNNWYPLEFTSKSLMISAEKYAVHTPTSTAFDNISSISNILLKIIISFLSLISFYINRSELWGLFIARYNPDTLEFLFGSGPLTLSNFYSEIRVGETSSFLLPHSSFLNFLLYFGIINCFFLIYLILKNLKNLFTKNNFSPYSYILLFIFLNILKSDSLIYPSSLIFYSLLFFKSMLIKNN